MGKVACFAGCNPALASRLAPERDSCELEAAPIGHRGHILRPTDTSDADNRKEFVQGSRYYNLL